MVPSPVPHGDDELQKVKKPGLKMSYEEYKHMANLLVLHMRMMEEGATDGKFKKDDSCSQEIDILDMVDTVSFFVC